MEYPLLDGVLYQLESIIHLKVHWLRVNLREVRLYIDVSMVQYLTDYIGVVRVHLLDNQLSDVLEFVILHDGLVRDSWSFWGEIETFVYLLELGLPLIFLNAADEFEETHAPVELGVLKDLCANSQHVLIGTLVNVEPGALRYRGLTDIFH